VPTPPGGPVDVKARLSCNSLPAQLGDQSFVVENKPGAGNIIGSKLAAEATPDGYTLHVSSVSGLVLSPTIHRNPGYSAASLASVALIKETPQVLVVNAWSPIKSVADLVAEAKAHPGKLNYSSGGIGTFPSLTAELFKKITSTNIVHLPYKGGHLTLNSVLAGEVQLTFDTLPTSLSLAKAGRLRAIANTGKVRVPEMPDVPSMDKMGYP